MLPLIEIAVKVPMPFCLSNHWKHINCGAVFSFAKVLLPVRRTERAERDIINTIGRKMISFEFSDEIWIILVSPLCAEQSGESGYDRKKMLSRNSVAYVEFPPPIYLIAAGLKAMLAKLRIMKLS